MGLGVTIKQFLVYSILFSITLFGYQNCGSLESSPDTALQSSVGSQGSPDSIPQETSDAPIILEQAKSKQVQRGENTSLSVELNSQAYANLELQWQFKEKGGNVFVDLSGEINNTLTINDFSSANHGVYKLIIRLPNRIHESLPVSLTLQSQPTLVTRLTFPFLGHYKGRET